jgi:subtilisin family serine protease
MPYFDAYTGRGVRVAVIDSGVHAAHPHVGGVAGGVAILPTGEAPEFVDVAGHGTAVAGAIREKAPEALLYAVKVFDRSLRTTAEQILRAIEWALDHEMHLINLSLGTLNPAHRAAFETVLARARKQQTLVIAPNEIAGRPAFPGCLPHVLPVTLDWDCPRDQYRAEFRDGRPLFLASGYPRSIPGVPPQRNLHGISFAVANFTGFVARAREGFAAAEVEGRMMNDER